jgi:hypothetical protein
MAYRSHHCSATLRYSVCISVFYTPLVLSVLLPFMLSAPCPFNAPFPFCTFLLLRSASFFTPQSHPTTTTTATHLFFVLHTYSLCAPSACSLAMLLHALSMSSALPGHHHYSSASLAIRFVCQFPLRTVFIPLENSLRLFSFSRNHTEVSSSPLADTISHF